MELTANDREMLNESHGETARFAMSVVVRTAEALGPEELQSIE
jgi:predicted aconitase